MHKQTYINIFFLIIEKGVGVGGARYVHIFTPTGGFVGDWVGKSTKLKIWNIYSANVYGILDVGTRKLHGSWVKTGS